MIRQPISRRGYLILGITSVLILVGFYSYLSYTRHQINPDDTAIPSWGQIWEGVVRASTPDERTEEIWILDDAWATFSRLFTGLALASVVSVIVGVLMGVYAPVEAMLLPPFLFIAKIPPTAMLPIFLVTVGDGLLGFAAMISFGVVPTLAQSIHSAAKKDVPDELVSKAHTLGASQVECIWNVIFMHILPKVLEAIRFQLGPALVYLIAAEALFAHAGFGYRIRLQARLLDMSVVFYYLGVLATTGFLIDQILIKIRKTLCPWYSV